MGSPQSCGEEDTIMVAMGVGSMLWAAPIAKVACRPVGGA